MSWPSAWQVAVLRGAYRPTDFLDAATILKLNTGPGRAMGFQLCNDANRSVRQGTLALLCEAFNNNWTVSVDCILTRAGGTAWRSE